MEHDLADLIAYLRTCPTEIEWGDDAEHLQGWVDVQVPAIEKALEWNWVWTILPAPDDDDEEIEEETIIVPYDAGDRWTPEAINSALMRWVHDHTGRTVVFKYNSEIKGKWANILRGQDENN